VWTAARGVRPASDLILECLCYDANSSTSIVASLLAARESARRARETISLEMWEGINTTWHEVAGDEWAGMRPASALRTVRERCTMLVGVADQTMIHDEGWQFVVLGRNLERADMTARLICSALLNAESPMAWSNALRACGAHHAFVRAYGGHSSDVEAAEFLLLDRLFPRSLVHALSTAEGALISLEDQERRLGITDRASMLLGRARAELEYRPPNEVMTGLFNQMTRLQAACAEASRAIGDRYFLGGHADAWQGGLL